MSESADRPAPRRLEELWEGDFGDAYTARNAAAGEGRERFWRELVDRTKLETVLEVGCNAGANLRWLAQLVDPSGVVGVDVSERALAGLRRALPEVRALRAAARELPFADGSFDLVFTTGVLIHVAPADLPAVTGEIVRCARRFVLCGEYFAEEPTEVAYRGLGGALFKRDFGALYRELHPRLELVEQGFLGPEDGFDDVTWWLFRLP
jgi:pseudaminic acid biosynthesis-associated methylase